VLPKIIMHSGPENRMKPIANPNTGTVRAALSKRSEQQKRVTATLPIACGPNRSSATPASGDTELDANNAAVLWTKFRCNDGGSA
jgi:hypothetical protein